MTNRFAAAAGARKDVFAGRVARYNDDMASQISRTITTAFPAADERLHRQAVAAERVR